MEVRQVAPALVQVEAVADEELVRNGEADVVDREVLDQTAVRAVEQGDDTQARGSSQLELLAEVVQRQTRVDHVLDEQDVEPGERDRRVLEDAHPGVAARRSAVVAGKLDEVELVEGRDGPREVGEEDEARLQERDEQQVARRVVRCDLGAELAHARADLVRAEEDVPDLYEAPRCYEAPAAMRLGRAGIAAPAARCRACRKA